MTKSCTRRDPDGTPGSLDDPAHAGGPAPTDPDLGFLWSGRRDSNPRPPPWQNSAPQMKYQRKLPKMSSDVHVRIWSLPAGVRPDKAVEADTRLSRCSAGLSWTLDTLRRSVWESCNCSATLTMVASSTPRPTTLTRAPS